MNDDNENLLWDSCPTFRDSRIFQQSQRQGGVSTFGHVEVTETALFCFAWVSLSWIGHGVTLPGEHSGMGGWGGEGWIPWARVDTLILFVADVGKGKLRSVRTKMHT